MSASVIKIAVIGLLGLAFLCVAGIIWLAAAEPQRSIPDILVGVTTLTVGAIVGILVPSKTAV